MKTKKIGCKYNKEFYKDVIDRFGISHQGVHWQSKYTQYLRFEVLTSFIVDDIKSSNIVDAGCGFAEYFNYLNKYNLNPKKYIGIDLEEKMIRLSKKRFPHQSFYIKNILDERLLNADYYVSSGALNILTKDEMFLFIKKCYVASNKGFVFNFLKNETLNNVKYNEILDFCKSINKNPLVKNNYLYNDISVYLRKT